MSTALLLVAGLCAEFFLLGTAAALLGVARRDHRRARRRLSEFRHLTPDHGRQS